MIEERPAREALAATWFGSRLPEPALARLEPSLRIERYHDAATLLREGQLADDLGIVLHGRVALRLRIPERGTVTILTVEVGDVVGWSAVVPPHRSTSTVVTVGPTEIVWLPGVFLRTAMADDPDLAAAVSSVLLEALARRLTGTRLQLLDLFARGGYEPW